MASDPEELRVEIASALETYLPSLAEAYATADADALADVAVPKEVESVRRLIDELGQQGVTLEPTLRSMTIESVTRASYSVVYATSLEVWDLRTYTVGSHRLVREAEGQRNRVKYQMKRSEDGWLVLLRHVEQRFE